MVRRFEPTPETEGETPITGLQQIDRQTHLTRNQKRLVTVVVVASCLEFFDLMIIGFVLAFIGKPWHLTFGMSAVILLASGVGGIIGAFAWGLAADTFGRRPSLIASIVTFSAASAILALTPERGWAYLSTFRFVVGVGVGGFVINMPFVQEFLPARMRGFVSSLVSVFIPGGLMLGAVLGAYLTPLIGWRGLFAVGALPALMILPIQFAIPESPVWAPTLLVLMLGTTPQHASALMMSVALAGMVGRFLCGYLSDRIGRKACGAIFFLGGAALLPLTALAGTATIATVSIFWLMLTLSYFFVDGGFSINGPYAAELWPSHLRATGMGVAYGFGSIGKITGPVGLALIVGASNFIAPAAMGPAVMPAFLYLAFWFALAGLAYGVIGIETRGRSFAAIDRLLAAPPAVAPAPAPVQPR